MNWNNLLCTFSRNGACLLTLHFQLKCEMTQSKVCIGLIICGMKTKSNNLLLKTAAEDLNYSSIPIVPNLCMHLAANNLFAIWRGDPSLTPNPWPCQLHRSKSEIYMYWNRWTVFTCYILCILICFYFDKCQCVVNPSYPLQHVCLAFQVVQLDLHLNCKL